MKNIIISILVLFTAGCFATLKPAISDISDSMVKVQAQKNPVGQYPPETEIEQEAIRGCAQYEKYPNLMSSRCVFVEFGDCKIREFLFTCKEM